MHRLVEPVVLSNLIDRVLWKFDVHPGATSGAPLSHRSHAHAHDLAFHGSARNEMHDEEDDDGDSEEGRNHQKKSSQKVRPHDRLARSVGLIRGMRFRVIQPVTLLCGFHLELHRRIRQRAFQLLVLLRVNPPQRRRFPRNHPIASDSSPDGRTCSRTPFAERAPPRSGCSDARWRGSRRARG